MDDKESKSLDLLIDLLVAIIVLSPAALMAWGIFLR